MLFDGLAHVKVLMSLLAVFSHRVEVALHHIVFAVDRSQTSGRLNENQAIHPIGHVLTHRRGCAVIDIEPRIQRLERELSLMARRRVTAGGSSSGPSDRMQVDVVWKSTVGMIHEMELDRIAFAHTDKLSGHLTPECPEVVLDSLGDGQIHFRDFKLNDDLGGLTSLDGWRH